jgi:catechol-2,3-dioxygenase
MSGSIDEEVIGQMRGGLVFVKTKDLPKIVKFYQDSIDMKVWLEQPNITILSHGNMLIGFHQQPADEVTSTQEIMYTFVYPSRSEVDAMYARFRGTTADGPPRENAKYQIYQFFAADPEGRKLEFQAFLHPLKTVSSAVR